MDKSEIGSQVWMYSFDHYSSDLFPRDYAWKGTRNIERRLKLYALYCSENTITGAQHTFDLMYLFDIDFEIFKFNRDEVDDRVSHQLALLWTNFAKFGLVEYSRISISGTSISDTSP